MGCDVEHEFGDLYGETMDDRHAGDYELMELGFEVARRDLDWAEQFVDRIEQMLREMGALE